MKNTGVKKDLRDSYTRSQCRNESIGIRRNNGFILLIVIGFLFVGAVFALSLSRFKEGAVHQLAKTIDQNRLIVIAQAASSEVLACLRTESNKSSPIGTTFRKIFTVSNPLNTGYWLTSINFPPEKLPLTNTIAGTTRGFNIQASSKANIVINSRSANTPASYMGYLEITSKAFLQQDPAECVEIKERRELKLANLSDFLDKYVIYVKNYANYNNNPNNDYKILINGILEVAGKRDPKVYSWGFLGNRNYPTDTPEFGADTASAPILLDLDLVNDAPLLTNFGQGQVGFQGAQNDTVNTDSQGQFFWVLGNPVPFKPIHGRGYSDADFFPDPLLQDFYMNVIVKPSQANPGNSDQHTTAYEVVQDFNGSGGVFSAMSGFRSLVSTCVDKWKYYYGYTDYSHIVDQNMQFTPLARSYPFVGVQKYFTEYANHNRFRTPGGKMPAFFGAARKTAMMLEGNTFLRFFKTAFFDEFTTIFELNKQQGFEITMPPLPLNFSRPDGPPTYLNREVTPSIHGAEKRLMSRAVDEHPINRFFFPSETAVRPKPEQRGSPSPLPGEKIYPGFDPRMASHIFESGEQFLEERTMNCQGKKVLDIDGLMIVNALDNKGLDLTGVNFFRGKGIIKLLWGNCSLGNLCRMNAGSDDFLKIHVNSGRIQIKDPAGATAIQSDVKIHASLIATSPRPDRVMGSLWLNGKNLEILGNLVLDYLPIGQNSEKGSGLTINHDEKLFSPPDPIRISIGKVKTMYCVNTGKPTP